MERKTSRDREWIQDALLQPDDRQDEIQPSPYYCKRVLTEGQEPKDKQEYGFNGKPDNPLREEENALRLGEAAKSPGDSLMTKELFEHIWDYVETLPEIYQDVFLLPVIHGFSIKETSMLLKTTTAAIKSRSHRGRFSIRKDLEQYLYEASDSSFYLDTWFNSLN